MPSKNQKKAKKEAAAAASRPAPLTPPDNFQKIISDMCNDLSTTFPEYADTWSAWTAAGLGAMEPAAREETIRTLFQHCTTVFPERFFDILYKNEDMFSVAKSETGAASPVCFLPGVDFKALYHCEGVSENTRNIMWNYLQLILFTIVGSVQDKANFGESKNLFEGINEGDLFEKLSETMKSMTDFFQSMGGDMGGAEDGDGEGEDTKTPANEGEKEGSGPGPAPEREDIPFSSGFPKMPNLKELHNHLKGLFDGKIGTMAKELAEEISGDLSSILGEEAKDIRSTQEVLQKLMKNPAKLSQLMKTISEKLKNKMSSGEVSQEDLMKEATEFMNKVKEMGGGMDAFKDMFKNMGVPMPKNARVNMNALNRMTQQQSMRERLKARMMQKKAAEAEAMIKQLQQQQQQQQQQPTGPMSMQDLAALSQELGLDLNEKVGAPEDTGPKAKGKKPKKR